MHTHVHTYIHAYVRYILSVDAKGGGLCSSDIYIEVIELSVLVKEEVFVVYMDLEKAYKS